MGNGMMLDDGMGIDVIADKITIELSMPRKHSGALKSTKAKYLRQAIHEVANRIRVDVFDGPEAFMVCPNMALHVGVHISTEVVLDELTVDEKQALAKAFRKIYATVNKPIDMATSGILAKIESGA